MMLKINKYLDCGSVNNEIVIEKDTFTIILKKDKVEIDCSWDYGWGGRGSEQMTIGLAELKKLIEELEKSSENSDSEQNK